MTRCQEESLAPDAAGAPFQYGQTSASSTGMQPAEHAQRADGLGMGKDTRPETPGDSSKL